MRGTIFIWATLLLLATARPGWAHSLSPFPAFGFGEGAYDPQAKPDTTWMDLPRFERIWKREGLRDLGAPAGKDTYVTITDDRTEVVALDVTTGKDRWRAKLPEGKADQVHIAGSTWIVAQQLETKEQVRIHRLDPADGHLVWSQELTCPRWRFPATTKRLFLLCAPSEDRLKAKELLELDTDMGKVLSRVPYESTFSLMPNSDVCSLKNGQLGCASLRDGHLNWRWKQPVTISESTFAGLVGTANFVVVLTAEGLDVRRLLDGRQMPGLYKASVIWIDEFNELAFVAESNRFSVHHLKNGQRILSIKDRAKIAKVVTGDHQRTVLFPRSKDRQDAIVVDTRFRASRLENNLVNPNTAQLVGDTIISASNHVLSNTGTSTTLYGYSLLHFSPPANKLKNRDKAEAILRHYQHPWDLAKVTALAKEIPTFQQELEGILKTGEDDLATATAALIGRSRNVRFLPPLLSLLTRLSTGSANPVDIDHHLTVVDAIVRIDQPAAANALAEYLTAVVPTISPVDFRERVKTTLLPGIWRYSAARDYAACPALTFPMGTKGQPIDTRLANPNQTSRLPAGDGWAVVCEARQDDNGDGKIEGKTILGHRQAGSDILRPYLVLGSGAGTEVDSVVAVDPHGHHLVIAQGTCLYDVDARTGKASNLPRADGRERQGPARHYPAAEYSLDGTRLAYLRSSSDWTQVVLRNLETGDEQILDPGQGRFAGFFFDPDGRHLIFHSYVMGGAPGPEAILEFSFSREPCFTSDGVRSPILGIDPRLEFVVRQASAWGGPVEVMPATQ